MTNNKFNLIDEPWVPVACLGLLSLREIFSSPNLGALGGTPLQKIALMKLLLAITQAAYTPENSEEWAASGPKKIAQSCSTYLDKWHEKFWLYGENPFLQMPAVEAVKDARLQDNRAIIPEIGSTNATVLTQWQTNHPLADAERALLLITSMSCGFGGKQTNSKVVLSPGHSKKGAQPGPGICSYGLLHTFLTGKSICETLWLNLLTQEDIEANRNYTQGLGTAPWEQMPIGEICETAQKLKESYMGRLVPLARFCLLKEGGLHYVEGLQHPNYQQGYIDPSVSVDESGNKNKVLWANPEKRPWRSLSAMLSFLLTNKQKTKGWSCTHLRQGIIRFNNNIGLVKQFGIWSGGIKVSSNAGEQYLTGADDIVESEIILDTADMQETWLVTLQGVMTKVDDISKNIYGTVLGYFKEEKATNSDKYAASATNLYWQMVEHHFQDLLIACAKADASSADASSNEIMKNIVAIAYKVFDASCPQETARQIQAWAKFRPKLGKYTQAH